MRNTGKSGVRGPKKPERMSQQRARGRLRLALAAAAESKTPRAELGGVARGLFVF